MPNKHKNGFTLIELLVVISIIGVLSGIILQSINSARLKSDDVRRVSDIKSIANAINMYFNDNGYYPPTANTCEGAGDWSTAFKNALVPKYIPSLPLDPKHDQRVCTTPWNYYYGFYNVTPPATTPNWGTNCTPTDIPPKIILYSVGRPSGKVFQDACGVGGNNRINTILFKK